jgi:hypothetical protein
MSRRRAVLALVLGILVAALSLSVSLSAQTSYHATVLDSSRARSPAPWSPPRRSPEARR